MRLLKEELLVMRLKDELPPGKRLDYLREMTKAECLERLRELFGVNFGEDIEAWENWAQARRSEFEAD